MWSKKYDPFDKKYMAELQKYIYNKNITLFSNYSSKRSLHHRGEKIQFHIATGDVGMATRCCHSLLLFIRYKLNGSPEGCGVGSRLAHRKNYISASKINCVATRLKPTNRPFDRMCSVIIGTIR